MTTGIIERVDRKYWLNTNEEKYSLLPNPAKQANERSFIFGCLHLQTIIITYLENLFELTIISTVIGSSMRACWILLAVHVMPTWAVIKISSVESLRWSIFELSMRGCCSMRILSILSFSKLYSHWNTMYQAAIDAKRIFFKRMFILLIAPFRKLKIQQRFCSSDLPCMCLDRLPLAVKCALGDQPGNLVSDTSIGEE